MVGCGKIWVIKEMVDLYYQSGFMQKLLSYLIQTHVTRDQSPIIHALTSTHPITIAGSTKITQQDLQLIHYLLEKKIINYHPSLLTIQLNTPSVLFYQRIHKLKRFCRKFTTPHFTDLFERFCQNELMPLTVDLNELKKVGVRGRGEAEPKLQSSTARKKEQGEGKQGKDSQLIDYQRLVYEYRQKQEWLKEGEVEIMINVEQVTQLYSYHLILKHLTKQHREQLTQSFQLRENTKHETLFIEIFNSAKHNTAHSQLFRLCTTTLKQRKAEDYMLQVFRRQEQSPQQKEEVSRNVVLLYNLVRKYPLISEKELLKLSLLEIMEQRKCLNLLVSQGILHYFPESIKSVLYKAIPFEQIETMVRNAIATAILNLQVVIGQRRLSKDQMLKMEAMLQELDDSLLLLGTA